jgi:hypothetical protein
MPGLRAGLSFMWSRSLACSLAAADIAAVEATFAAKIQHRKRSRFVLSRMNDENRSCYRG